MRRCCWSLALASVLASAPALAGITAGGPATGSQSGGARASVTLAPEGDLDGSGSA